MSVLISDKFKDWEKLCDDRFNKLKSNEEELNRFFIDIYGIGDEVSAEVDDSDVTVRRAELQREIKSLISYAVGCIFGRYSLDREGLCYAGGEWDSSAYSTIIPCPDNVMTLNDMHSGLTAAVINFIETVYGSDTLDENLGFIATALGNSGDPKTFLYNYLKRSFFTDHSKVYKNRPIYWQISSGKKSAFSAFMYLHRCNSDFLKVLTKKYAEPHYEKLQKKLLDLSSAHKLSKGAEKSAYRRDISRVQNLLLEMEGFLHRLRQLSEQNVFIDLDDGVKTNYEKFKDILV